jgi:hypothetical protein
MHRYYFHDHLDETVTRDSKGALFQDDQTAVHHAVERAHTLLKGAIRRKSGIDIATEISNGKRTIYVVRGKIAAGDCFNGNVEGNRCPQASYDELLQSQRAKGEEISLANHQGGSADPRTPVSLTGRAARRRHRSV